MKLEQSVTFENLARAYAGECQAHVRYKFVEYGFRYNGYEAIAELIDNVVYHEFNHARMLYTYIQKSGLKQVDNINIDAGYPFKEKWDLEENLELLTQDESDDAKSYKEFIAVAKQEGFDDVADLFEMIMNVELKHKALFKELYKQFSNASLYKKDKDTTWCCLGCGYSEMGKEAWEKCPLCEAEQGFVKVVLPSNICT